MGVTQPYLKITIFCKRKEGMTPEECHAYWTGLHSELAKSIPGWTDVAKRYVQLHSPPELRELSKKMGLEPLDWDGYTQVWMEDIDEYVAWCSQPETAKLLGNDNKNYLHPEMKIMVGYETLEVGEPIPGWAGKPICKSLKDHGHGGQ